MATARERPYGQFNVLVDLETGGRQGPHGGFQEVSASSGPASRADVTLKRGLFGGRDLHRWFDQERDGDPGGRRTVRIQLQSEDRSAVVQAWKLLRARIVQYTAGPSDAKGGDVAVEAMVVAYERLEIE